MSVPPLRKRIMPLDELRKRTRRVLRQCIKQFNRKGWQPGMSDSEFISKVIESLLTDISQDIEMEKILVEIEKQK